MFSYFYIIDRKLHLHPYQYVVPDKSHLIQEFGLPPSPQQINAGYLQSQYTAEKPSINELSDSDIWNIIERQTGEQFSSGRSQCRVIRQKACGGNNKLASSRIYKTGRKSIPKLDRFKSFGNYELIIVFLNYYFN